MNKEQKVCGRSSSVEHQLPKLDRRVQFPSPALSIFLILFLSGCATTTYVKTASPKGPGIYHRVERKETLWAISRLYGVDLDEVVRINHITDVTSIETGQLIFIPRKSGSIARLAIKTKGYEDFIWPARGRVISLFGTTFRNMLNKGINIRPAASPEVVASRRGRVVFCADNFESYGSTIIIDHGDGFLTIYAGNFHPKRP